MSATKTRRSKRRRVFVVWCANKTDPADDEPLLVRARTHEEALQVASQYQCNIRFYFERAWTLPEFARHDPEWSRMVRGDRVYG